VTAEQPPGGAHAEPRVRAAVLPSGDVAAPAQDEAVACMACGHTDVQHDATARRYCDATIAHAMTRGCICRIP
jgi:hypothetical protein